VSGVVTILLGAGKGERLGGPKALLLWPGAEGELPLSIAHAEARLAAESERVLCVTREAIKRALEAYARPGLLLVASSYADALGPAGSIAAAMPFVGEAELVVVTPVDTPPARGETVAKLCARLRRDPGLLGVKPSYGGRGGHPVVLRPEALLRYREEDPPPLRDHLRSLGDRVVFEEVEDAGVRVDLDTPGDVMALLGQPARFMSLEGR